MSADAFTPHVLEPLALRLLLNQVPAIVWTTDRNLCVTSCAGAGLQTISLQGCQVVGRTLFELFDTEDDEHPPVAAHLRALCGDAATYELATAGRTLICRVEPLPGDDGHPAGVIGLALDVTERRRAERQLRDCRKRLRGLRQAAAGGPPSERSVRQDAGSATPIPEPVLTRREREVLRLTVEGYTSLEIADRLLISPRTVECHRGNLMRKLGVRNQRELVGHALRRGILTEEMLETLEAEGEPKKSPTP